MNFAAMSYLKAILTKKRLFCILFWSQPKEYDHGRGGFPEKGYAGIIIYLNQEKPD